MVCRAALVLLIPLSHSAAIPQTEAETCPAAGVAGGFDCLHVPVPENRATRRGREIDLHVVVLPATGDDTEPDPVFLLMGGPGQSATDKAAYFASYLARVREKRDLVLVDYRGTGESNPLDFSFTSEDLMNGAEDSLSPAVVRRELERLRGAADFTHYTTDAVVDDLDDVRVALGYEEVNLYGGSYGTRVALVYLRRYGEHARSAVLKGVAPLGFVVGQHFARDAQRSLDRVFDACAADPRCSEAYGDLRARFAELMRSSEEEPRAVEAKNPLNGSVTRVTVSPEAIASTVHTMLYGVPTIAALPGMIARGADGDLEEWGAAFLGTRAQVADWLYEGMALAVLGAEDSPRFDRALLEATARGTFLGEDFGSGLLDAGSLWPHAELEPSFWEPVSSSVPVLLVSGGLDPVTPPAFGDEAARHLEQGRHLVFPHGSHGDEAFRPCLEGILEEFYASANATELDTSCVEGARTVRFLVR